MAVRLARRSVWQLIPLAGGLKHLQKTIFLDASQGYWYTTKIKPARELISPLSHTCASHTGTLYLYHTHQHPFDSQSNDAIAQNGMSTK